MFVDFYQTGDASFGGSSTADLEEVTFYQEASVEAFEEFYTSEVSPKQFPWVFSGMKKQTVYIESDKPAPMGVRAILAEMEIRN